MLRYHTNAEADQVQELSNVSTSCLHRNCQMWVLSMARRIRALMAFGGSLVLRSLTQLKLACP